MKFEFIDAQKAYFPIEFLCIQLGVSRSGYYAWKERPESKREQADRELAEQVVAVHQHSRGTYGSPRVHAELRARGRKVSRKRVARLMSQQGLAARQRRRFVRTTDSRHGQPVAPNLLNRDFSPPQPDGSWVTDITYIWTRQGWLYLAVILDLYSRRVVGWAMSERIDGSWPSTHSTWRSRDGSRRTDCCTTRTGAVSTPARTTSSCWRPEAFSAA